MENRRTGRLRRRRLSILKETENWNGKKLLITDGVFSMDGDIANLPALCDLAEKYSCIMMVDDAHSSGVLGSRGRGTIDHLGCHGRVDIQVGTLSKAIGSIGGYVCGSRDLIDFLYQRARPFLFSTSHRRLTEVDPALESSDSRAPVLWSAWCRSCPRWNCKGASPG